MKYNTSQSLLVIPEYGRNIQNMIEYAITIEDREKRNRLANVIVNIMGQLNPHLREALDYKQKLWDHLFIISDFKLDVDSPYVKPSPEVLAHKPVKPSYPNETIKFKPYGKNIENIIQKAIELDEGLEKDNLTQVIANQLKKSYLSWNRDSVNDELIINHLDVLSGNKLKLKDEFKLDSTNEIIFRNGINASKKKPAKPFIKKKKNNNFNPGR
ncbi:MAG: DUF4290 domain-containing protein [Bacteroidota bacterium]